MSKSRKKCWSHSVGVYGSRVRVSELVAGGTLYLIWVDSDGKQQKRTLGHRDRKRGKEEALAYANRMANERESVDSARLTVAKLFDIYERHGLHGRTETHRREVKRKLALWISFLGGERTVESLSPTDIDRFVEGRRNGTIKPPAKKAVQSPTSVGMTTVWHDYVALTTAIHFATRHRDKRGKPLLLVNPLNGVRVSKTVSPVQAVADGGLYEALCAIAGQLNAKFLLALELAYATGHRIDAILKLRWDDISFAQTDQTPFGTIRWREEHDKIGNEHVVPMSELAFNALQRTSRERPGIGEAWVFPSDTDDGKPVERRLASRWFRRAEKLAGIEHVKGRGWHSFRRGWASDRKHLPDVDVAAAGGWKDTATMKRCYQHADAAGVLNAVISTMRRVSS